MKKFYSILLVAFMTAAAHAQIVNIPNSTIKFKLLQAHSSNQIARNLQGEYFNIDANNNDQIEVSEALQVSYIDISDLILTNLNGINNFTNLTELDCSTNHIASLGLTLPNLTILDCSTNYLTAIDTSTLPALTQLICHHNHLTSLTAPAGNGITKLIVGSSRVDLQACKLEYSIVSPK